VFKFKSQNCFFYIATLVILAPLFALGFRSIAGESDTFAFLVHNVLDDVLMNSLAIMLMTSFGVLLLGVGAAWFITQYCFWGRGILQWAFFMPLAFPAYILAYVYTDFFDEAGQFAQILKSLGLGSFIPDFRTFWGASFILTFCLYPYVL